MRQKGILVLTSWSYKDALIQVYTLPYLLMISFINPDIKIYLYTEEKNHWPDEEVQHLKLELESKGIIWMPKKYHHFGLKKSLSFASSFFKFWYLISTVQLSYIHCFCTPSASFGYLLSTVTGKKLIIDSYEPHAESMVENGTWKRKDLAFKLLWWFEKKQSAKAVYCIGAASGMDEYAREKYGVWLRNFRVKPACVDLEHFSFNESKREKYRNEWGWADKIVCVYAGKFGGIYLTTDAFVFFKTAYDYWGEQLRILLLTATKKEEILFLCREVNLPEHIIRSFKAPLHQMPHFLSIGDFAFTPVKPVPSKRFCTPIKDGEYWAIGLPVVIPANISDDSDIIKENNAGAILESLTVEEYKKALITIQTLLKEDKQGIRLRIRKLAEKYRPYSIAMQHYREIYTNGFE